MPPATSSSFIPKRNPGAKPRAPRQKNIFILTIVSYSLFVAAPLASAGVAIYQIQANKNLNKVVANLNTAITSFNEADFDRVLAFDKRLSATNELVTGHVSVTNLLNVLGGATANTVQFKNLELIRKDQNTLSIKADLLTPALDGALYQRGQYDASTIIDTAKFTEVKLASGGATDATGKPVAGGDTNVTLKADFSFTAESVKYSPVAFINPTTLPPDFGTSSSPVSDANQPPL